MATKIAVFFLVALIFLTANKVLSRPVNYDALNRQQLNEEEVQQRRFDTFQPDETEKNKQDEIDSESNKERISRAIYILNENAKKINNKNKRSINLLDAADLNGDYAPKPEIIFFV